jgi:hypothetical protein
MAPHFPTTPASVAAARARVKAAFLAAKPGELVGYNYVVNGLGLDVLGSATQRGWLHRMINSLAKKKVAVFQCEKNVGYRRLPDTDIVGFKYEADRKKTHRHVNRAAARQGAVDTSKLSNGDIIKHSTNTAMLGALAGFTRPAARKKIEKAGPVNTPAEVMRAFLDKHRST